MPVPFVRLVPSKLPPLTYPVMSLAPDQSQAKGGRPLYILVEDFYFYFEIGGMVHRFVIPKGYLTDKASTPWFVWTLGFTPEGLWEPGAIIHDFLYQHKGILPKGSYQVRVSKEDPEMWGNDKTVEMWLDIISTPKNRAFSRKGADQMFKRINIEYGVPKAKAVLMYDAVRTCGAFCGGGFGW